MYFRAIETTLAGWNRVTKWFDMFFVSGAGMVALLVALLARLLARLLGRLLVAARLLG